MLDLARQDADGAILDVGMAARPARDRDPQRVGLVTLGERHDPLRQGRREHQRTAFLRRLLEDEF